MRKFKWLVATILVVAMGAVPSLGSAETPLDPSPSRTVLDPAFLDVGIDHPFAADIRAILAASITTGCNPPSNNQFCPERVVTRAEMAAFLSRSLQLGPGVDAFVDATGHPLLADINALAAAGITRGCNPPANDRFCPDAPITRQEMAAFLDRALDLPTEAASADFTDTIDSEFATSIARLAGAGITRGCNPPANDRFCPSSPVSRGEMAAFLSRGLSLPSAPATPSGLTSTLSEDATDLMLKIRREVCDLGPGGDVVVRNAALGHDSIPTSLTISTGVWDPHSDVWTTTLKPSECATIEFEWDATKVDLSQPVNPILISSRYGNRLHPIAGVWRLHSGVDLKASSGAPITAAAAGVVSRAGWFGGYGNMVDIAHPGGLTTRYAHMSSIGIEEGAVVAQGDVIGLVGCTGSCTGPHLHWETRVWDEPIDPTRLADWLSYAGYDSFAEPLHSLDDHLHDES